MNHTIDVQIAVELPDLPSTEQLEQWANLSLNDMDEETELTIRIVDEEEAMELNSKWRSKPEPTNVLSFPVDANTVLKPRLLGDIVICAPVIAREAQEQGKSMDSHFAHMVIHGTLHLLGYDHIEEEQAIKMEAIEVNMLKTLQINNPYKTN